MKHPWHFAFALTIIVVSVSAMQYRNSSPVGAPPTPNVPERQVAGETKPELTFFAVKIRHPKYKERIVVFKIWGETKEEAIAEALRMYGNDGVYIGLHVGF